MPNENIEIYTDGACSGNPGPGGCGFSLQIQNNNKTMLQEYGSFAPNTTNNKMEMLAAIAALTFLEKYKTKIEEHFPDFLSYPISLHTDSSYLLQGLNSWIHNWKKNKWKTQNKTTVKNIGYWKLLDTLNSKFSPKWIKVAAHSGHPLNDRVDEIAVYFSKQIPCKLREDFGDCPLDFEKLLSHTEQASITPEDLFAAENKSLPSSKRENLTRKNSTYPLYISLIQNTVYKDFNWEDCKNRVHGVSGVKYKKVKNAGEEKEILKRWKKL